MTPEDHRHTHFQEQLTFFIHRARIKTMFPVFLIVACVVYITVLMGSRVEFTPDPPPAKRGIIYNIGPDQTVRLGVLRNKTPLDTYIPPWADPAHDSLDIANLKQQNDLKPQQLPLCSSDAIGNGGRLRELWYLSLPDTDVHGLYAPTEQPPSQAVPELTSTPSSWGQPITPLRRQKGDDIGWIGNSATFEVVLNAMGSPSHVILLEASTSPEADAAAGRIIRGMRWTPSTRTRSGIVTMDWKEALP